MNFEQLRALTAIVDEGTFEAAADVLKVTPSAVSQRIKALERTVGQLLIIREVPCRPTDAGEALLRTGRQVEVLIRDATDTLGIGTAIRLDLRVAVNADSLATWFPAVFAEAAQWTDTEIVIHVEDQDQSSQLLRRGDVVAAITADPVAVNGCRIEELGSMRYVPVASASLRDACRGESGLDWGRMPMLRFGDNDYLQHRVLDAHGVEERPPVHTIPSAEGCLAAARAGMGWAMFPQLQLDADPAAGSLVRLDEDVFEDVPLYWQTWSIDSRRVDRLSAAVREAGAVLMPAEQRS